MVKFISFLGTGKYEEVTYKRENFQDKNKFIQISTLRFLQHENENLFSKGGEVIIFLTEGARKKNWEILNKEFDQLKKESGFGNVKIVDVNIPDGRDEREIWEILNLILKEIKERDELYIDVTHAFRYLPLLLVVVIHLLKNLKNVTIKSITYGNFEGRDENNIAPIVDLTRFNDIMSLTDVILQFRKFGYIVSDNHNDNPLNSLLNFLGRIYQGTDKDFNLIRELDKGIKEFSKQLIYCDGGNINRGDVLIGIKNKQSLFPSEKENPNGNDPRFEVLKVIYRSLLDDLKDILSSVEENNSKNVIYVAKWAYEKNLYQQAVTLLYEGIVNLFTEIISRRLEDICKSNIPEISNVEKLLGDERVLRTFTSKFVLNYDKRNEWKEELKEYGNIANYLLEDEQLKNILDDTKKELITINQLRNQYNHAHFNKNENPPDYKRMIGEHLNKIVDKLQSFDKLLEKKLIK